MAKAEESHDDTVDGATQAIRKLSRGFTSEVKTKLITPYFEDDYVTLYHGDALAIMPKLPVSPTVIVTDPPYGETSLAWDKLNKYWPLLAFDITAGSASLWCFGSFRMFHQMSFSPWQFAQDLVWEKHNGSNFHADRFRRVHEHAAHFYKGLWRDLYKQPVSTNDATRRMIRRKQRPAHTGAIDQRTYVSEDGGPRLMRSVLFARSCHGYAVHPTQKPIDVIDPLLRYSCETNAVVLDMFAGSGSTLVACRNLGIRVIGIERDRKFCRAAASRLNGLTKPEVTKRVL